MTGLASWSLVATVKAPAERILAFLAWHLDLGADRITLCFDDPEDTALPELAARQSERVRLIACDNAHWQALGGRPERHQNRQAKNARKIYRSCRSDWLGHIDVDEFILPLTPLAEVLSAQPPEAVLCRMEPFEAMHMPALHGAASSTHDSPSLHAGKADIDAPDTGMADDIYTACAFRGALKPRHAALRLPVLGEYTGILPEGMLSHTAGKVFFRTGIEGLSPRLHGAFIAGERLPGPAFHPALRLLHFHAQDRQDWLQALPFRLTRGAYQYRPELQAWLAAASDAEIADFYAATQILRPDMLEPLRKAGRLVEAQLHLRRRVAERLAKATPEDRT